MWQMLFGLQSVSVSVIWFFRHFASLLTPFVWVLSFVLWRVDIAWNHWNITTHPPLPFTFMFWSLYVCTLIWNITCSSTLGSFEFYSLYSNTLLDRVLYSENILNSLINTHFCLDCSAGFAVCFSVIPLLIDLSVAVWYFKLKMARK